MSKIQLKNATIEPYFHKLNLIVDKGASLAISGGNRLALFRTIAGFMKLESGSYQLEYHRNETKNLEELAAVRQEKMGYVAKNTDLLPKLTVLENLELPYFFQTGANQITASKHQRLEQLSRLIGIHSLLNEKAYGLDEFEERCVSIVRACINSPSILLLEEFTMDFSEQQCEILLNFFKLLKADGVTLIATTENAAISGLFESRITV
ncbi:MAG: ATP-binding cassette domain-containing protein [Kurthia sp.]|nr:ATP-binding cassette domain-containing protein [Candidatus Kurthia equi]